MEKGDTDTDIDTLMSEISIPILILILFKLRISILIRYRYDTLSQKYRIFDTDTIVSKTSAMKEQFKIEIDDLHISHLFYGLVEGVLFFAETFNV